MKISEASYHTKKNLGNQTEEDGVLTTPFIVDKATATFRASLGVNNPHHIWAALGLHIEEHMKQQKAVRIIDFGVFGLNQNSEPTFVQDPVFLHMTRLCSATRKCGNNWQSVLLNEHIVDVDAKAVAAEYLQNCSKDLVRSVIASIMAWITAWAKDGQVMRVEFLPVGEWTCTGERVDFRFFESFCNDVVSKTSKEDEPREAEAATGSVCNQNEELNAQPGGTMNPASKLFGVTEKCLVKQDLAVETTFPNKQAAGPRNESPVVRSRYKLRAPTRSSIAKQRPPLNQRRNCSTTAEKRSANSDTPAATNAKMIHSVKPRATVSNEPQREPQQVFNPGDINAVTRDIIAATKKHSFGTSSSVQSFKTSTKGTQLLQRPVETIDRLRRRIRNRRSQTVRGLNAVVAVFKAFKTGSITPTELSLSLRKLGVKISSAELKELSIAYSHRRRGCIDIQKLIDALRGPPLSTERQDLVTKGFRQMDPSSTGTVCIDEMIKHYDVGFLPQVRDGTQTRLEALTAFLEDWASFATGDDNTITFEAFVAYYHNVSACIAADADFARLMGQTWRTSEESPTHDKQVSPRENSKSSVSPALGSTTEAVASSLDLSANLPYPHSHVRAMEAPRDEISPKEALTYLCALLFPQRGQEGVNRLPTLDNMSRRLGANRILGDGNETMNIKAFAHSLSVLDKRLQSTQIHELSHLVAAHCADTLSNGETISLLSLYRKLMSAQSQEAATEPVDNNTVEIFASRTIDRIRRHVFGAENDNMNAEVVARSRLDALEKSLRQSSTNSDAVLSKFELRTALRKIEIEVTFQELDYLFAYFDIHRDGFINCDSFLEVVYSGKFPKFPQPQRSATKAELTPASTSKAFYEPPDLLVTLSPQSARWKKQQIINRVPQPNFRRRNLIHRAIWDQSTQSTKQGAASAMTNNLLDHIDVERRRRYRAAQLIQTIFRGFRSRQLAAQLRRKQVAQSRRLAAEYERLHTKRKTTRTALPSAYGF